MTNSDETSTCGPSTPSTQGEVNTTAAASNLSSASTCGTPPHTLYSTIAANSSSIITTASVMNSLPTTTSDATASASTIDITDAFPGQGDVASGMSHSYTQCWPPQGLVGGGISGVTSTHQYAGKSSENLIYMNSFPGLPNATILNTPPYITTGHVQSQGGQTDHSFLNSTQIHSCALPRTAPFINNQHMPFLTIEGYANNQQNQIRPLIGDVTQNCVFYSSALPPSFQTSRAANICVTSQRSNVASNLNAFDGAQVYSQPISSTLPLHTHAHAGLTTTGNPLFNNSNTQLNNSADVTMSSSHIAARHVLSKDLPSFSGKPDEWPVFFTNYCQSTERCGFTEQENLIRLQKCLKGPALEAVRGQLMMPSTVNLAIQKLQMLFGRADIIHHTLQTKLRSEPKVRADNLNTLISLALAVQNYCSTIQAIGLNDYLNDPMLLNDLLSKLPANMKLEWGRHCISVGRVNLLVFDQWLFSLATCASQVTTFDPTSDGTCEEKKSANKKQGRDRIMFHDVSNGMSESNHERSGAVPKVKTCQKCGGEHKLAECPQFISLTIDERWQFIRANKLCLHCFGKHVVRRCYHKKECGVDGCKFPHNALLHASSQQRTQQAQSNHANAPILFHGREQKVTMFRYVPVTLHANQNSINAWALIDEGAACTLIENAIATELGLDGPSEELCLRWTGDVTKNYVNSKTVSFNITSREWGSPMYNLNNVRTITSLDLPEQSLEWKMIESCKYLRGLPIKAYNRIKPSIIIGLDNAKLGVPLEIREGTDNDFMAARCRLGWSVYGRKHATKPLETSIFHICDCTHTQQETDKMDDLLQQYFSLESVGVNIPAKPLTSLDHERAMQIMESTTAYSSEEKRWYTGLLWKYDQVDLPDSLAMARRRLKCLEAKMIREPSLKQFLVNKLEEYEQKGYIRKLEKHEVTTGGKSWYIPIFTVTNINKNKTRLVWDAAAKVDGIALNTYLLKGPDLMKSLIGVLLRFREKPVAICGDIREMFHQVKVIEEDQRSQMFLWRGGDATKDIDVYCMQVMTFGASCSPSLANYIKNKNASRFIQHPAAVNAIIENTFVDDWLQSCQTEEEMIELAEKVRDIHNDGGFEMRNWISNSTRVLEKLTGEQIQIDKCIPESESEHEKVLGMWWLPHSDEFTFIQKFNQEIFDEESEVTKRQILRIIMKIFDPLGILGNFLIHAKITLQDVWRSGVSWDEPIREDERKSWFRWVKYIPMIENIRIPRSYPLASKSQNIQLHVFVDASSSAYAAVAYIRAQVGTEVSCSLIASKTRVAPLKPISIPRMELMAAIIGLRLATFIEKEHCIKINRRTFWSDSKDVLYWIRSDARKFKQFVALRIGEILENSHVNEWRWTPSTENVADEGTKWSKPLEFDGSIRWFSGPTFLRQNEEHWPTTTFSKNGESNYELLCHIEENQRRTSLLADISPDPSRFSKWEKLRWTQAYILRFLKLILNKEATSPLMKMLVKIDALRDVESVIFRNCQEETYAEEIDCLKSEATQVSRKSSIFKCSPYLDELGVLRVKGRIDAAEGVDIDVKRPIILPRYHAVTDLVVDFYHRRFHHHHNEIVVNELRQRFWISGIRALVRAVSKNCQACKNRAAIPCPPEMGDLPPERLAAFTRPFTYTGVDYFGPFDVIIGRRREKRWGVLFTCLTVRAVHLEISPSLSTDSFMLIFKQFVSRRGTPKRILSDNGTNFRGASRLLTNEVEKISGNQLRHTYPEIEWVFIPPASPHMGGAWERMVRSVKSVLTEILPEMGLREEVLRAAMADVEHIINSRPLTYIPLESADAEALTPNHFLIGSSSGIREKGSENISGVGLLKNFKIAGQLADQFWKRWLREYLPCLTRRSKWFSKSSDPICVNDVVIIVDDTSKRESWLKGIVVDIRRSKDKEVRSAVVRTVKGLVTRPAVKLAKLDINK